ncbi:MAG: hypothetical protein WC996_08285 [Peptostreptococcales bacterium]
MSKAGGAIKKAIQDEQLKSPEVLIIEQKLNSLFLVPRHTKEVRRGLHASAIIASPSSYCIREQVLSLLFERNKEENLPIGLLRIFEEGNCIHEKWQTMFERAGIARGIEDRGYSALFDLYMTPDAVVEINKRLYVVEIKSANTFSFKHMKDSHPSGTKQLQLYMHFLCIPRGFVLAEDKNTQDFKIFPVHYEPGQAKPFVERLYDIKAAKERFEDEGVLPVRLCNSATCKRAEGCAMSDACFGRNKKRLPKAR